MNETIIIYFGAGLILEMFLLGILVGYAIAVSKKKTQKKQLPKEQETLSDFGCDEK